MEQENTGFRRIRTERLELQMRQPIRRKGIPLAPMTSTEPMKRSMR